MRALTEPGLYFLAGVLDSTGTTPWAYALMARTIMSHIAGHATLEAVPLARKINHFELATYLAARDPVNFPAGQWVEDYLRLATMPADQPLPIPDQSTRSRSVARAMWPRTFPRGSAAIATSCLAAVRQ
jgi:hypothetical protein